MDNEKKEYFLKTKRKNLAIIKKLEAQNAKIDVYIETDYFPEKSGRKPKVEKTVKKEEKNDDSFWL